MQFYKIHIISLGYGDEIIRVLQIINRLPKLRIVANR